MLDKDIRFHLYSFFSGDNLIAYAKTCKAHRTELYQQFTTKIKKDFNCDPPRGRSPIVYYSELIKEKNTLIAYVMLHNIFSNYLNQEHWQDFLTIKNEIMISPHLALKRLNEIIQYSSFKFNKIITNEYIRKLQTTYE